VLGQALGAQQGVDRGEIALEPLDSLGFITVPGKIAILDRQTNGRRS
jgi:hypothetical protein